MTKKERVLSAMRGEKTDKIPVSFWRHFAGAGTTLSNREVAQKHLDFYQATDLDFIKIMYDGFTAPFSLDIKTAAELRKIRPVKEDHPYVRDILERAKWVNELLSDQVDTWMNLFSPFMLIKKLGEKQLAALIDQDRYAVIDALTAVGETLSYTAEKLLTECGCKGIFVCFQGAEFSRFTKDDFMEIVRPSDLQLLHTANQYSPWNFAHFCAWDGGKNDLSRWQDYPACAVNWAIYVDDLTLPEGKAYFGGRPVLGGFDNRMGKLLFNGTREEIETETRRLVSDYVCKTGSEAGLIIGADCSFLPPFELERFNWVSDTLREIATGK